MLIPLQSKLAQNTIISYFDEFRYFTKATTMSAITNVNNFSNSTLKHISIPNSVTSMTRPFGYCRQLVRVICYRETPPSVGSPILGTNVPASVEIYVPDDSVDAYKTSWSSYASRIFPMSDLDS